MLNFLLRRLAQAIVTLLLVSIIAFLLVFLSGDPVSIMMPVHSTEEDREVLRRELGLDQPPPAQYVRFLRDSMRGDLGTSIRFNRPVVPLIISRIPATLLLASVAIAIAMVVGTIVGLVSGIRRGSRVDQIGTLLALTAVSVPNFWLGIILILVMADGLRLLPAGGSGGIRHVILPALTLSAASTGLITRLTRASVVDESRSSYVTSARAKGLPPRLVKYRHILRNALIPTVTVVGLQFGYLLTGSVIVETVFGWPGVGWLLIEGVYARDLPLVRGLLLLFGLTFILLNLFVDLFYRYLDPRIRLPGVGP